MTDVIIIGGGPAGLSAAVQLAARGRQCTVFTEQLQHNPLYKAKQIDNYLGLRGASGADMLARMQTEAQQAGARFVYGRVLSVLHSESGVMVSTASEMEQGQCLILAGGAARATALPGEKRLIGRGVSYCATCDGMLYRGKRAVVTGNAADIEQEVAFLERIGVEVIPLLSPALAAKMQRPQSTLRGVLHILGENKVSGVRVQDQTIPCDAVFILRRTVAPSVLLPQLEMDGPFIRVDRQMKTNLAHVYAAGDCTGHPLQIAKAVGEGLVAAHTAAAEWDALTVQ